MTKRILLPFIVILLLTQVFTTTANAYSYGDPNKEDLAEAYKKMLIELDKNPPDYNTARKHYETVKEEVDMHMGPDPSKIILQNLEDKDKEQTIENLDELLVLNIARRLENVESKFSEFDTSKRLLAKGFATYEALSPKIEAKNSELDKEIKAEFDKALVSLGNPGLFGVGQKEADQEAFIASQEKILSTLQTEFNIKSLEVGHFSESATQTEQVKNNDWTDLSNIRNWIPIIIIVAVIALVVFVARRKRKRNK
ncbi:hypothetical protein QNH48_25615 [Neobacillus sp. YX16]|uniref:hypothetical protein n=1 Tax=Neobacillus sp. YX16 TaxID=3047874 RepID=UPI0024C43B67|nr:hypothetical protein [Neobacillus sp. YX16]WHZ02284.1 hypothetical protein QNH48_25615 [Neobacillus sp. YX16]